MNVLFDASWLTTYVPNTHMHGGLRVTYELAKRLAVSGKVYTDFTFTDLHKHLYKNLQHVAASEFGINGSRVIINDSFFFQTYLTLSNLLNTNTGMGYIRKIYSFVSEPQLNTYDIYHSPVEPIPSIVQRNKNIKPFLTALDLIALVKPEFAYEGFYELLYKIYHSINERTTVLAISQSTKNDLLNYRKDIREENVIVTYIAADKTIFYPAEENELTQSLLEKYGLQKGNFFFTLSAFAKFKNTDHTISSFLQYANAYKNKEVKMLVVGRNREANYDTNSLVDYKAHPQIVFVDFIPDKELSTIYTNAIAFLYMSLYEGFGLPILEAMQCGTPVICSNTSSMPEVIGNAGICISPTDTDVLCDSMNILYSDTEKRKLFSALGLERSQLFSWDNYARDVVRAYQRAT